MAFAVTVLRAVGGHRWVCVEGTLDRTTVGDVEDVLRSTLRRATRRVTLDLSQARVDDDGMAGIARLAEQAGVELLVFDGTRQVPVRAAGAASTAPALALAG